MHALLQIGVPTPDRPTTSPGGARREQVASRKVSGGGRILKLSLVGTRVADRERAALLADRLAARRIVSGEAPEWQVLYEEAADTTEAMALCEAELTEIDPCWLEILDFQAMPSRRMADAEFG